jgi:hypothetical protein
MTLEAFIEPKVPKDKRMPSPGTRLASRRRDISLGLDPHVNSSRIATSVAYVTNFYTATLSYQSKPSFGTSEHAFASRVQS